MDSLSRRQALVRLPSAGIMSMLLTGNCQAEPEVQPRRGPIRLGPFPLGDWWKKTKAADLLAGSFPSGEAFAVKKVLTDLNACKLFLLDEWYLTKDGVRRLAKEDPVLVAGGKVTFTLKDKKAEAKLHLHSLRVGVDSDQFGPPATRRLLIEVQIAISWTRGLIGGSSVLSTYSSLTYDDAGTILEP